MSDRLPYEEQLKQQWNDLPLPDENMAWADMERRLEEDDDKSIIPFWLRGCGVWSLLAVILLGLGWWFFRQYTSNSKKEEEQKVQRVTQQADKPGINNNDSTHLLNNQPGEKTNQDEAPQSTQPGTGVENENGSKAETNPNVSITAVNGSIKKTGKTGTRRKQSIPETKEKTVILAKGKQVIGKDGADISVIPGSTKIYSDTTRAASNSKTGITATDSSTHLIIDPVKPDSSLTVKKDSLKKKDKEDVTKNSTPKKDSAKQKSISFSAGIAENQIVPIDGQMLTPYNAQGRKGSLRDYIPSVYFRMYKDGKWFLQSEFRYGAPQYNREFVYSQKGVPDTSGTSSIITSTKLKKTFYHQLPLSFNYFVLPNWSVGTGFVWNKFNSAVSTQDVVKRTIATGSDTVVSVGTIVRNAKADSNFAKSYFQAIIETQYKWKRFSLGARYSFGLQPYIKFTLPGGAQQQREEQISAGIPSL